VNMKTLVCQIIGLAAAGSARPVPTPMLMTTEENDRIT